MDDICRNIAEYNPNKKLKLLVVLDDIIAYMLINKNLNAVVTELFIRRRKLNISLAVPNNIRLNFTQYLL